MDRTAPRVMVIEGDRDVADLLWVVLSERGYHVRLVDDRTAALMWSLWRPQVVLLDAQDAPATSRASGASRP